MQHRQGFSLIEIMTGLLIVSIITIAGFQALGFLGIGKIKLIERTKIQQEAYFISERLFELIKTGGTIDYEEYWNRYNYNATAYSSGHFFQNSGFGNYGNRHYCVSGSGLSMGTGGCLTSFNLDSLSGFPNINYTGQQQVYNQYRNQFIDYNADADGDLGNEDGSTIGVEDFKGDDDDIFLGIGPGAFSSTGLVSEIYLINAEGTERTFFRWSVKLDPFAPLSASCSFASQQFPTGSGCLGTIQMLKLTGVDEGPDHGVYAGNTPGGFLDDDGEIDTWLIHKDFDSNYGANPYAQSAILAGSTSTNYWQNIFPDTINVKNVEFYLYPNTNIRYAWKDGNLQNQISPYVQIKMTLEPSQKEKRRIKGSPPQVNIATTIHLSSLDFQ